MNPESPTANSNNWPDNTMAITASGSLNSSPNTNEGHFQKMLNGMDLTREPDNQAMTISGGSPSTTGSDHFQILENRMVGSMAADGLGGVPKSFTLNGNKSSQSINRSPKLNADKKYVP